MDTTAKDAIIDSHNLCGDDTGCRCEESQAQARELLSRAVVVADVDLEILRDAWLAWAGDGGQPNREFNEMIFTIREDARSWATSTILIHGNYVPTIENYVSELGHAYDLYIATAAPDDESVATSFDRIIDGIRAQAVYEAVASLAGGTP